MARASTDDSRLWRYLRRSLLVVAGIAVAYFIIVPLSFAYVVTHTARGFVPAADLGAAYEEVSFKTSDGLTLEGWYIPSKNRAAVIAFPGRAGSQRPARMLARNGYGVLLFDRRGEGESDGDPNIFGWKGERDVHAAVAYLQQRPDVDPERIGGIGLSVGGEMMIEAAAAESDGLKAVVSEGAGIRSIRESLAVPDTRKRIEGSLVHAVVTPAVALFSNGMPPPSLEDLAARDLADSGLPHLRRPRAGRRSRAESGLLRRRARAQDHLACARRRAHGRDRGWPGGIRAACHRVPRRRTARGTVTL